MFWIRRLWLAAPLVCGGCGSSLTHAVAEFEAGRAPEAMSEFRALEPAFGELDHEEKLRYSLYRGLAHLSLGDLEPSRAWIFAVKRAIDRDPLLFSDDERGRLFSALRSLGHMPGE